MKDKNSLNGFRILNSGMLGKTVTSQGPGFESSLESFYMWMSAWVSPVTLACSHSVMNWVATTTTFDPELGLE